MIIWGWRGVARNGEKGKFHCPQCRSERDYQRKKVQRFFTLYFIPLIPLQVLHEAIQCQLCKKQFVTDVLKYDPRGEAEARQRLVTASCRTVLAHFAGMSERRDTAFYELVAQQLASLGCEAISAEDARADIAGSVGDFAPAAEKIRPYLTEQGREHLVTASLLVATQGSPLTPAKESALASLAQTLTMSEAYLKGIVATAAPPAIAAPV